RYRPAVTMPPILAIRWSGAGAKALRQLNAHLSATPAIPSPAARVIQVTVTDNSPSCTPISVRAASIHTAAISDRGERMASGTGSRRRYSHIDDPESTKNIALP